MGAWLKLVEMGIDHLQSIYLPQPQVFKHSREEVCGKLAITVLGRANKNPCYPMGGEINS